MTSSSEIESVDKLSSEMTVGEALEVAKHFEWTAHEFYSSLVEKVRPEIQPLVRELAAEEKEHLDLLEEISREPDVIGLLRQRTRRPPTMDAFCSFVELPSELDEMQEDGLLEHAISRERLAYEHYGYLAEITPAGPLKELFALLQYEEEGHNRELETRWLTMFSIF